MAAARGRRRLAQCLLCAALGRILAGQGGAACPGHEGGRPEGLDQ